MCGLLHTTDILGKDIHESLKRTTQHLNKSKFELCINHH